MLGSTIPVSIIGTRFAMSTEPFWTPVQYGLFLFFQIRRCDIDCLCSTHRRYALRKYHVWDHRLGELRSQRIEVTLFFLYSKFTALRHSFYLSENRDKVEMYLAFGASRLEACKPIATEALRLALTPTINQMRYVLVFFCDNPCPPPSLCQCLGHHCHPGNDDGSNPRWFFG